LLVIEAIKRQASRKKIMEQYCQTNSYEKEPRVSRENLGYIIVNDEYKFMYCTIPKVGTSTWKKVFAELRGLRRNVKVHRWNLWKRLYQYSEEERNIRLQTYFKFLFVRDPLKRLLSAYKNKFIGSNPGVSSFARMHMIKEYRPKDLNKNNNWVSFPEFIQYFSEDRERNQHWRQYEKLCHPCAVNYSFIGHLETLEDDAHLLLKMAGIDDRVSFPPVHKSTSLSEILDYYSQVPVEYITRLGKLYRSDFEMFGYNFPGDLQTLIKNSSSNR
ncbi:unnamed protein product, partial [Porites lobata]